jgi:hypothetical protein
MRNLLQDADRDRLVAPLVGPLAGEAVLGGRRYSAMAEAPGSRVHAAVASADTAELLLQPGLREAHAPLGDALLDFVMAMADAPDPVRSVVAAAGQAALLQDDPRAVAVETPFHRFAGDLMRGELRQSLREGHAELRHTGNLVEFGIFPRRFCVDVEDGITAAEATREGDAVVLRHVSTIRATAGWLRARPVEAGTCELRYTLRGDSPVIRVVVRFTALRPLARLRVTTALDALTDSGLGPAALRLKDGGAWRDAELPNAPGPARLAAGQPVSKLVLGRREAGAPVAVLRPLDPARVMSVTGQSRGPGALHWLLLRHGPATLRAGESLEIAEDRLLAHEGDPGTAAADAAPCGAALQAVAAALLLDAGGAWPDRLPPERRAALQAFARRQAARIEAGAAEATDLARAAVGADALRRAGEPDAAALQSRLLARLETLTDPATGLLRGAMRDLPAQALAVLALARAAAWPGAATAALAGALAPFEARPGEGLRFAGAPVDPVQDAEGLALLARAAGAAALAAEAGAALPPALAAQAQAVHRAAITLLRPLARPRLGILEVAGRGGVTASLQALATLALLAPDRLALDSRPADAVA